MNWRERAYRALQSERKRRKMIAHNEIGRSSLAWRADVLAADPGATFGRSACGRFEIAFARAR